MRENLEFHIIISDLEHDATTEQPKVTQNADDCYQEIIRYFEEIDQNLPTGTNVTFNPKDLKVTINKPDCKPIIIYGSPYDPNSFH